MREEGKKFDIEAVWIGIYWEYKKKWRWEDQAGEQNSGCDG